MTYFSNCAVEKKGRGRAWLGWKGAPYAVHCWVNACVQGRSFYEGVRIISWWPEGREWEDGAVAGRAGGD